MPSEQQKRLEFFLRQEVCCPQCAKKGNTVFLLVETDKNYRYLDCPRGHYAAVEPKNWKEGK